MLFNSLHFLLFLPVVIILYYLLPQRFRWLLIFVASCYFYMALVPYYILILFFIIILDYFSALAIEKKTGRTRKIILALSICSNVALLAFFKYFNFINDNITLLWNSLGWENTVSNLNVILPIGLSFHTFQSMAYTIEVYRGNQKAERHLGYFANYVLFFPQMVAGPIERYSRLGEQLKERHSFLYENFSSGFRLMLFGFFAKMVIADNLAPFVNSVYNDPVHSSSISVLKAVFFFSFQIYADFYGYSLIAMGSAKLMGVDLMQNFRTPYLSKNIVEFWKRWHISLSSWFRDYLYIPLGGSQVKVARWIVNILIVFLISGLWHGPRWTFVIWGLIHAVFYLIERGANRIFGINPEKGNAFINTLRILKTFLIVTTAWIFFRSESMDKVRQIFNSLVSNSHVSDKLSTNYKVYGLLIMFILFDILLFNKRVDQWLGSKNNIVRWSIYSLLIFAVFALGGAENIPFIYFQF